jgi:hypothetical protein
VEDALARNRTAKERFGGHQREWHPPTADQLKRVIGCEVHQVISHEMSAFA